MVLFLYFDFLQIDLDLVRFGGVLLALLPPCVHSARASPFPDWGIGRPWFGLVPLPGWKSVPAALASIREESTVWIRIIISHAAQIYLSGTLSSTRTFSNFCYCGDGTMVHRHESRLLCKM